MQSGGVDRYGGDSAELTAGELRAREVSTGDSGSTLFRPSLLPCPKGHLCGSASCQAPSRITIFPGFQVLRWRAVPFELLFRLRPYILSCAEVQALGLILVTYFYSAADRRLFQALDHCCLRCRGSTTLGLSSRSSVFPWSLVTTGGVPSIALTRDRSADTGNTAFLWFER